MMERDLRNQLAMVGRRYRWLRLWRGLAASWLVLLGAGGGLLYWTRQQQLDVPRIVPAALAAVALLAAAAWLRSANRLARNGLWVARRIEARFPELDTRLLAAWEQRRESPDQPLGYLQQTVIREALAHSRRHAWTAVIPDRHLWSAGLVQLAAFAALAILLAHLLREAERPAEPQWWFPASRGPQFAIEVEPQDTELERGTSLLALARFQGPLPPEVTLLYRAGADRQQLKMSQSLDDPLFAGRIPAVAQDLEYAIGYGSAQTRWYQVRVFDYPELQRADVQLTFPDYTQLEPTLVEDTRRITAVEGTVVKLICRLNKPVKAARLQPQDSEDPAAPGVLTLAAEPADAGGAAATVTWTLAESQRYRLLLTDAEGRMNRQPPEFVVRVTLNQPPELKLAAPARDVEVSPLEELTLKASLRDDFGLRRYGLSYALGGQPPQEVLLGESLAGKERREVAYVLALETLQAEPDQLVSYHFWAEDTAADGAPRRTSGDMYFAEVRPFEEIFRQGEQPPGGQPGQPPASQNAQRAAQLAELQKQIINATWKLMRRELTLPPTAQFVPDVKLIDDSQGSAAEQARSLGEDLQDARSQALLQNVLQHMQQAREALQQAANGPQTGPLDAALAAEQAAYQALLRLRAREHNVIRGNPQSGGGGGGGGGASQQQLDQLELKQDENRYETQRTASEQQDAQQRETRQVLNRLRELAQRQEDLNQQMKELQAALEAARDEAERQEIQRQLARLRDQQQQMLRDTDELRDRMDRPENQERMADSRQQLEETRSNIRRASEALEQGLVSQAAASGTRAADDLNRLREDFRQAAANQFNEAMTEMRQEARELDEAQQRLAEQLKELGQTPSRSLRDSGDRKEVTDGLRQQKEDLAELLEAMRATVEEAETAEPLLARQLYDSAREAHQEKTAEALEISSQLLERGFVGESRVAEKSAGSGIRKLREGIEKAAESVLGDETEGLRRARAELDSLAEQLQREIRRGRGEPTESGEGQQLARAAAAAASADQGDPSAPPARDGEPPDPSDQAGGGRASQPGDPPPPRGDTPQGAQPQQGDQPQEGGRPTASPSDPGQPAGPPSPEGRPEAGGPEAGGPEAGGAQAPAAARGGEPPPGDPLGNSPSGAESPGESESRGPPGGGSPARGSRNEPTASGDLRQMFGGESGPGGNEALGPITGDNFRGWSDRLRDVEEMVGDPELRAQAARIRDRARSLRADFKRHSEQPNWDLVQDYLGRPLFELRQAVSEELLRRESADALVPVDREPVPPPFAEPVRRYYERLGSGR